MQDTKLRPTSTTKSKNKSRKKAKIRSYEHYKS